MDTLSAENAFVRKSGIGRINVQMSMNQGGPAFDGAVAIQFMVPGDQDWATLAKFRPSDITAAGGDTLLAEFVLPRTNCEVRIGIVAGDYKAGTIGIRV